MQAATTAMTGDADDGRLERWRERVGGPLTVIAVGTVPLLLLELARAELPAADRLFLDAVNVAVLVVFAVDYLVELHLAVDRRRFVRTEWSSLLIVVAQVLAVVPSLAGLGALRAARGARVARVAITTARLVAIGGAAARQSRGLLRRKAVGIALGTASLTWVTSAVAFTLVEDVGTGQRVGSFFDALWWSTCTITTVGYGDVHPVTPVGRSVAAFTMLVGVTAFAVVTAKLAEHLVGHEVADIGTSPED